VVAVTFTSSQITTPSDPTYPSFSASALTLPVEGNVSGGDGNADVVCFHGAAGRTLLKANVTVTSGTFSDDVPLQPLSNGNPSPFCLLRAVPTGDLGSYPPGTGSGFAGPRIGIGTLAVHPIAGTGQVNYASSTAPRA
jgi:hypothetical protein